MTFPFYNPVTVQDPTDDSNPATKVYVDNGLSGKAESGHDHSATYSPLGHTHTSAAIVAGVLDIARIPTGTSGTTVSFGNHNHDATYAGITHEHAAGDVTSGTLAIGRIPTGTSSSTVAIGNDSRLSDARTPTAHASTHATGQSDAIAPSDIGASAVGHAHAGADITSGTVNIARIPTGTTGSTVPFGNDSRFSDARTPTSHVHSGADITSGTVPIGQLPTGTSGTTVALGNHNHDSAYVPVARTITAGTGLTGGGDLSANRTLTVAYGTSSTTAAVGNDTRLSVKPYPPVTLTDQATVTTDASLGTHFRLTGTAARTIAAPTNPTDGQVITYEIKASSGALTHTWNAIFTYGSDVTALTAIAAGKTDFIQWVYSSAVTKWLLIGYIKGFTT